MATQRSANMYCYDMVSRKVNVGAENFLGETGNNTIRNWSPNNIRRLIVSAEGFIVQYFTIAKNPRLVEPVMFRDIEKVRECFSSPNYKPMVQTLIGSRICSSVEEIVYLTKPNQWGMSLPASELDIRSLLSSHKSSTTDAVKGVGERFVRLSGLTILNMGLQEFYKTFSSSLVKSDFQLSGLDAMKGNTTKVHSDWWNHTYLRPNFYSLDADGGKLSNYFSRLKEEFTLKEREQKLAKLACTSSVPAEESEVFSYLRNTVVVLLNLCDNKTLPTADRTIVTSLRGRIQNYIRANKIVFTNCEGYRNLSKRDKDFISVIGCTVDGVEDNDAFRRNFNSFSQVLYLAVVEFTLDIISDVASKYPTFCRYCLKKISFSASVPEILAESKYKAEVLLGERITKVSQMTTLVNCVMIICLLAVPNSVVGTKKNYTSVYWREKLRGGK